LEIKKHKFGGVNRKKSLEFWKITNSKP